MHDRELRRAGAQPNWELDPVTRSLLDTDFYKLLMLQFIWKHYPKTRVQFTLYNRSASGPVDTFAHEELIEQLDHARELGFRRSELVWLAGGTRSTAAAEFSNLPSWNGWNATSASQTTNSP